MQVVAVDYEVVFGVVRFGSVRISFRTFVWGGVNAVTDLDSSGISGR